MAYIQEISERTSNAPLVYVYLGYLLERYIDQVNIFGTGTTAA